MNYWEYIILFILFISIQLIYFKVAEKYNIKDKPNERSSHSTITLRGGGIIFPIVIAICYSLGYINIYFTLAILLVALISFIDDIQQLPLLPRFTSHFIAVCLIFYNLQLFSHPIWILPLLFVLMIAWINAFNFMDGINGITVLYALVTIISFTFISKLNSDIPLLYTMSISCVVFAIFNVRKKAKTFAGDVGSISMAVFLGYFMIKTILITEQYGYILFFSIYGIDSAFTILTRLLKKENILKPHRSHLYQYLANEYKYPHILVASIYAGLQLIVNLFILYLDSEEKLSLLIIIGLLSLLVFIYLFIRTIMVRQLNKIELK